MPEISRFFSIRITMYYDEHRPPHFHAEYNGKRLKLIFVQEKLLKEPCQIAN